VLSSSVPLFSPMNGLCIALGPLSLVEGRKGKEVGAWREGERRGRVVGGKRNLTNKGT
jgi:hypothetical protein